MRGFDIRRIRQGFLLSQDELGGILGVTGATILRWEKGTSTPPARLTNDVLEICARVAMDTQHAASVHALVKGGTEPAAVLWYILNQVYASRVRHSRP